MGAAEKIYLTPQAFIEFERKSFIKHEYLDGKIFDMSGASILHNTISINLTTTVSNKLKGKNCRPFGSDLRIHIPINSLFTYPDLSIVCDEIETTDDNFDTVTNPTVIFEILSASTRDYDLGKKFMLYRQIPSLKHYVMIDSEEVRVIIYSRNIDETWILKEMTDINAVFKISAIAISLDLQTIYEKVTFKTI